MKENYFELFEIPVQFHPDPVVIKKKFYELSRKYHPDFHSQSGSDKQAEVLETSSMVNRAYKTFLDEDATIRYILKLHGLLEEEEKYELDKGYLMEVLELNELLMEADVDDESSVRAIREKTETLNNELYNDVKPILDNYQEAVTSKEELLQVKDYYFKKKYLQRILDKIG
jgi:molecular chaperone HscB